jgi:hypothetical protein
MAILYGRAGRSAAQHGVCRQIVWNAISAVQLWFGRIIALHHSSTSFYHIH